LSEFPGERPEFARLRDWAPGYRERCWSSALRPLVDDSLVGGLAAELDAAFREHLRLHCPPYDDVVPMLQRVAPSYSRAVLTNGPSDVQRAKLRASGLEGFFPIIVTSGDIGFGKPDPRIFTTALERLDLRANEAIAIGDSLERDVVGARAAGVPCVWLNRDRAARSGGPAPDHEIASLGELSALLS
jgi:putative hydrolase of the HAD superfamily